MITHRVMGIEEIDGITYFQTKGDANPAPDPDLTPAEAAYGKVTLTLPRWGYVLTFAPTVWGKLLLIGLPLLILVWQEVHQLLRMGKRNEATSRPPELRPV